MGAAAAKAVREIGRVSAQLLDRLPAHGHGCVDGVFPRGFNVAIGEELLYVGGSAAPLSCVGAALPAGDLAVLRDRIAPGDLVTSLDGVMRIYDRDGVSRLDLTSLERVDMSLEHARRAAIDPGVGDALARRLLELDLVSAIGLSPDERVREQLLVLADRGAGALALGGAVEFLLGRGLGLTPSGDDILMGAGVARWLQGRERPLIAALGRARLDRTTPVSRAYLRALIAGTANGDYLDLARALAEVRPDRLVAPLERIRATGHTSGADALLGFALGWGLDMSRLLAPGVRAGGRSTDGRGIGASDGSFADAAAAPAAAA